MSEQKKTLIINPELFKLSTNDKSEKKKEKITYHK